MSDKSICEKKVNFYFLFAFPLNVYFFMSLLLSTFLGSGLVNCKCSCQNVCGKRRQK